MHQRIADVLEQHKVPHKLHVHSSFPQPINGHHDLAKALGYEVPRFTKTLFLEGSSGVFCLAVAPSCIRKINLRMIAGALDVSRLSLADEGEIPKQLDFAIKGVSPLACGDRLPVFIDSHLLRYPTIVVGAGVEEEGLEIAPAELINLTPARLLTLT